MKELEAKIQLAKSRFDKAKKRLEFLLETKAAVETEIVVSARNVFRYHFYYAGIRDALNTILNNKFRNREGKLDLLVLRAELECAAKSILNAQRWANKEYEMIFEPVRNKRGKITGYKASFYEIKSKIHKI